MTVDQIMQETKELMALNTRNHHLPALEQYRLALLAVLKQSA